MNEKENSTVHTPTLEFYPAILDEDLNLKKCTAIPISQLASMGVALEPMASAITNIFGSGGGSGLYYINVPSGTHLAAYKNGSGYIGAVLSNSTNVLAGQSTITPLAIDPTLLFVSIALMAITKKMDEFIQTGQEIMKFLEQKEKANIIGSIHFLTDTLNNYKFNWNNKRYIESNLTMILSIRKQAEQNIALHKMRIDGTLEKDVKLHYDQNVRKKFNSLLNSLRSYQLALYMMSFSSFLDVIFTANYNSEYIDKIVSKIKKYSLEYRDAYTNCYNFMEGYSSSSLQNRLLNSAAEIGKMAGCKIAKIPVISKGPVDEALIVIDDSTDKRTETLMEQFIKIRDDHTRSFVDSIISIGKSINEPNQILFDSYNIYLKQQD